jgi:PAS domain S-box-containing protein
MTLRIKLTLLFVAIALIPLAVVGWLAYAKLQQTLQANVGLLLQSLARQAMDRVDGSLGGLYRQFGEWAQSDLLQEVLTDDADARISTFLIAQHKRKTGFTELVALNSRRVIVAADHPGLLGQEASDWDCARALEGSPYLRDAHQDSPERPWVVTMGFPIIGRFDPSQVVGALCGRWRVDAFSPLVTVPETVGPSAGMRMWLVRRDGLLLNDSRPEADAWFTRNLLAEGWRSVQLAAEGRTGAHIEAEGRAAKRLVGYASSVGSSAFPGLGWVMLVSQDIASAFAPLARLQQVVIGIGAAVFILVVVVALLVAGRVTNPLLALVERTRQIASGDFASRLERVSRDEFGQLAAAFNRMAEVLQATTVSKRDVDHIIQSIPDALMVVSPDRRVRTVNAATPALVGYEEGGLIGMDVRRLFVEGEEHPFRDKRFELWLRAGAIRDVETRYRTKAGEHIPVSVSGSAIRDAAGRLSGLVVVARDLRQTKRLQQQLVESEKMAAVGMLGAGMAHELNNPLMGITGLVSYVKDKLEADDKRRQLLADAEQELKRCSKLVTDQLTSARPGDQQAEESSLQVDCREIVQRALAVLEPHVRQGGVSVTMRMAPELPRVWGNANQLQQVVLNLLANAIDAMGSSAAKQVTVTGRVIPSGIELTVSDTGCGIPPEHLPKVFNPFFTTKPVGKGTGLGLSVARSIVEAHRGELLVESRVGQGTTMIVRLPLERRGARG